VSKTNCQVEYIHERLRVNVDNVALGLLLAKIQEKTGVEFVVGQEQSGELISCQLESLPMVEGLKKILSHFNHAILFGPDNKPMKVVILGYHMSDSSPRPREVAETLSVQRVISPSSVETKDIQPATKEGMGVTSSSEIRNISQPAGEGTISPHFIETAGIKPASVEDMVATPSTETMVIAQPMSDMIVIPSSVTIEPMAINPTSVEDMIIPTPPEVITSRLENMIVPTPPEVIASRVENMIIGGFTGESRPKAP
jgi:hypothetical protein